MRLAATIADLAGTDRVEEPHVVEAIERTRWPSTAAVV